MAARARHTCSTLIPRRSASVFAERSAIAVRTQPGSTALDVTPNGPASWATARASPITPCLEAVYALPERSAFSPAVELVNTSRPKPRLHIPPTVSRASSKGPSRLTRIVSRQTSGSCSHTSRSWAEPMPWFTTSTSIGPSRRSVSATARAQPSAVPRSAATYSRPTAASSVALRDTAITRAPAAESSSAASRPIPRPPPVTSATRAFIGVPREILRPLRPERDCGAHRAFLYVCGVFPACRMRLLLVYWMHVQFSIDRYSGPAPAGQGQAREVAVGLACSRNIPTLGRCAQSYLHRVRRRRLRWIVALAQQKLVGLQPLPTQDAIGRTSDFDR